jgi:branched-subunit amino acid transport protein
MKRAMMYITPIALFALWVWIIVQGIDDMTAQENNNHAIARLLGCEYVGRLENVDGILIHKCGSKVEFVEELKW